MEWNIYEENDGCKYFIVWVFVAPKLNWMISELLEMKTLLVYLPNNVIRSIFRVPRSFRRYVKLVFLFFDHKAKTLRNQSHVLNLEIIDRW